MSDEEPGGQGVAYIDLTEYRRLCVRHGGERLLTVTLEYRDGPRLTEPVVVDLGAFLVDLQLTADDCKRALDDFGNQGLDTPEDAP